MPIDGLGKDQAGARVGFHEQSNEMTAMRMTESTRLE